MFILNSAIYYDNELAVSRRSIILMNEHFLQICITQYEQLLSNNSHNLPQISKSLFLPTKTFQLIFQTMDIFCNHKQLYHCLLLHFNKIINLNTSQFHQTTNKICISNAEQVMIRIGMLALSIKCEELLIYKNTIKSGFIFYCQQLQLEFIFQHGFSFTQFIIVQLNFLEQNFGCLEYYTELYRFFIDLNLQKLIQWVVQKLNKNRQQWNQNNTMFKVIKSPIQKKQPQNNRIKSVEKMALNENKNFLIRTKQSENFNHKKSIQRAVTSKKTTEIIGINAKKSWNEQKKQQRKSLSRTLYYNKKYKFRNSGGLQSMRDSIQTEYYYDGYDGYNQQKFVDQQQKQFIINENNILSRKQQCIKIAENQDTCTRTMCMQTQRNFEFNNIICDSPKNMNSNALKILAKGTPEKNNKDKQRNNTRIGI